MNNTQHNSYAGTHVIRKRDEKNEYVKWKHAYTCFVTKWTI